MSVVLDEDRPVEGYEVDLDWPDGRADAMQSDPKYAVTIRSHWALPDCEGHVLLAWRHDGWYVYQHGDNPEARIAIPRHWHALHIEWELNRWAKRVHDYEAVA